MRINKSHFLVLLLLVNGCSTGFQPYTDTSIRTPQPQKEEEDQDAKEENDTQITHGIEASLSPSPINEFKAKPPLETNPSNESAISEQSAHKKADLKLLPSGSDVSSADEPPSENPIKGEESPNDNGISGNGSTDISTEGANTGINTTPGQGNHSGSPNLDESDASPSGKQEGWQESGGGGGLGLGGLAIPSLPAVSLPELPSLSLPGSINLDSSGQSSASVNSNLQMKTGDESANSASVNDPKEKSTSAPEQTKKWNLMRPR
ncbi:hypothetical protein KOI40_18175 [Aestuariicella sp. G3-2]|uniref:hypothetical protein n=1 Tax=Pseudomaricurvus albidus TaxID=2842452 RepID=UPI001C0BCF4D|nr:hypothetical protein [Aestuariicella albida]MBU3071758.1 hypothetical protein [Aestuariicella albida]